MNNPGSTALAALLAYPKTLPPNVTPFFVHYQCDNFDDGVKIYNFSVCDNSETITYDGDGDEVKAIEEYCHRVEELRSKGFLLVHWNQNTSEYGPIHIRQRYFKLTGKHLALDYKGSLNMSNFLYRKYGNHYVDHPRLDNLARLNGFRGIRETEAGKRQFPTFRVLLLSKIYFEEIKGTLKMNPTSSYMLLQNQKGPGSGQDATKGTPTTSPDEIQAGIEDHLSEFEPFFKSVKDYEMTVSVLFAFFNHQEIVVPRQIFLKKKMKVRLAYKMGSLYKELTNKVITYDFLQLLTQLFAVFNDEVINPSCLNRSNLYKYCTSKS